MKGVGTSTFATALAAAEEDQERALKAIHEVQTMMRFQKNPLGQPLDIKMIQTFTGETSPILQALIDHYKCLK
eukprot:1571545-Alexandrium_andersonii.AAC.1